MTHPYLSLKPAPRFILCICFALSVAACSNTPTEVKNPTDDPTNNTTANTNDPKKTPARRHLSRDQRFHPLRHRKGARPSNQRPNRRRHLLPQVHPQRRRQSLPRRLQPRRPLRPTKQPQRSRLLLRKNAPNRTRLLPRATQPGSPPNPPTANPLSTSSTATSPCAPRTSATSSPASTSSSPSAAPKTPSPTPAPSSSSTRPTPALATTSPTPITCSNRFPLAQFIINGALEIDQARPRDLLPLWPHPHPPLTSSPKPPNNFRRATELRSDFPEAQNALGLALYRIRDFDGAEAAFSAAHQIRAHPPRGLPQPRQHPQSPRPRRRLRARLPQSP
jgi:hypothetical protein